MIKLAKGKINFDNVLKEQFILAINYCEEQYMSSNGDIDPLHIDDFELSLEEQLEYAKTHFELLRHAIESIQSVYNAN